MTVRQLIHELDRIRDKEQTVYLSRDEEGNGFRVASCLEEYLMVGDGPRDKHPVHEDDEDGYDADELEKAVIIWP